MLAWISESTATRTINLTYKRQESYKKRLIGPALDMYYVAEFEKAFLKKGNLNQIIPRRNGTKFWKIYSLNMLIGATPVSKNNELKFDCQIKFKFSVPPESR